MIVLSDIFGHLIVNPFEWQKSLGNLLEHTPVPIELQSGIYEITKNPENPNKFIAKEIIIN